ncbi:MAG TPA: branched-chain amino acid ABC transporter substrate-binding protein [Gaiellaceae bacterium]|nr:branched-chain amino acid ABC transporter substrate-binding protein [Gaiellaceae bacterium]
MLKRVGLFAVTAGVIAAVVAATLGGTASARNSKAASANVKCGSTVTIGLAYPATGPDANLGATQADWANWARKAWNKTEKPKISFVIGDTQLGAATDLTVGVAHAFKSNSKILGVVGPPGSQEMEDSASIWKSADLAPVSGSETRVALTRAKPGTPRETTPGYFFRTVPNDGQQGDAVATWIHSHLKFTHIYVIDDEEAYSQGLAAQVIADLTADGVTGIGTNHISQQDTNFSSVIDAIPSNTQLVYIPWQLPSQAETFYQQLKASGKTAAIMGSDGTDLPGTFQPNGNGYVSGFPVDFSNPAVASFSKAHHGNQELFGLPSYTATMVNATAIQAACKAGHGSTNRTAVRAAIAKVKLSKAQSLLGFPVSFLKGNHGNYQGAGDMGGAANFAIYKVTSSGAYQRAG